MVVVLVSFDEGRPRDFRHVAALDAVAEQGSFAAAGASFNRWQPATRIQMQQLEAELATAP